MEWKANGGASVSLEGGEELKGSMVSPSLMRGWPRGYALHFTDKRVIGVKKDIVDSAGAIPPGIARPQGGLLDEAAKREINDHVLRGLDQEKDFDMKWADVRRVDFKRPGLLVGGHVSFYPLSGEAVSIMIGTKMEYEMILTAVGKFVSRDKLTGL